MVNGGIKGDRRSEVRHGESVLGGSDVRGRRGGQEKLKT